MAIKHYKSLRKSFYSISRTQRKPDGSITDLPSIDFENGVFRTADPEKQKYLAGSKRKGRTFKEFTPEVKQKNTKDLKPAPKIDIADSVSQINEAIDYLNKKEIKTDGVDSKAKILAKAKENDIAFPNLK